MPTFKLDPDATSYWVAAGARLEIPDSTLSQPALANDNNLETGIQVNETDFVFGIDGAKAFTIGSTLNVAIVDYETLVTGDDDIPNKKFVDDNFAVLAHNHDASYAAIGHNHDADYAPIGHNHDGAYVGITGDQTVGGTKTLTDPLVLASFTVATLPTGVQGMLIYVTDESGGPTPAHYDGTNWRRVYDNVIVS